MIVVSDTTPLNYLIIIRRIEILHSLYNEVVIPRAVLNEMQARGTPATVIDWMRNKPVWIVVKEVPLTKRINAEIEEAEAQAIVLAEQLQADLILLDDRRARQIAAARGLRVIGTLGVLVDAARRGLIDFRAALAALEKTNFRISPELLDSAAEQARDIET